MEDEGQPALLLRGGESPHSFSLRPSAARLLSNADILFWIGPELERPLARLLPSLGPHRNVAMLQIADLSVLGNRQLAPSQQANGDPHGHASHDADVDPHVWLSPVNAVVMVDEIVRQLSELDPQRSAHYQANGTRLNRSLLALDTELADRLAGVRGNYAVFHDAYQYLEHRYGLRAVAAVTTHAERRPGAARLSALRKILVDRDVRCLFSEPEFSPRLVGLLREDLPLRHAVLDPLGAAIPAGPAAYFETMHTLVRTLTDCMQKDPP
jgi:zinc transport system substrate-binding protein